MIELKELKKGVGQKINDERKYRLKLEAALKAHKTDLNEHIIC